MKCNKHLFLFSLCLSSLTGCSGGREIYTVTFETCCDAVIEQIQVPAGSKINNPGELTKHNFSFISWQHNGHTWDFENDKVKSNMTLKALWTRYAYDVTATYDDIIDGKVSLNGLGSFPVSQSSGLITWYDNFDDYTYVDHVSIGENATYINRNVSFYRTDKDDDINISVFGNISDRVEKKYFDSNGYLIRETLTYNDEAKLNSNTCNDYTYDSNGRMLTKKEYVGDVLKYSRKNQYFTDHTVESLSTSTENLWVISTYYDEEGQISKYIINSPFLSSGDHEYIVTRTYDNNGKVKKETNIEYNNEQIEIGTATYSYESKVVDIDRVGTRYTRYSEKSYVLSVSKLYEREDGQVTGIYHRSGNSVTGKIKEIYYFSYNDDGLLSITQYKNGDQYAKANYTYYYYNDDGSLDYQMYIGYSNVTNSYSDNYKTRAIYS